MTWRYIAASVIGSSHAEQAMPCQDSSLVHAFDDDMLLLVAADGAGSAKHSADGSQLACLTLAAEVRRHVADRGPVHELSLAQVDESVNAPVMTRLRERAVEHDIAVRELACTLLMALVTPRMSHFAQVGDGAIVVGRNGQFSPVTWPDIGEYANTTYFVTGRACATAYASSAHHRPRRSARGAS